MPDWEALFAYGYQYRVSQTKAASDPFDPLAKEKR